VLFDNGAGPSPLGTVTPGDPYPAFEASFPSFPVPGTGARYWYLAPGGGLSGSQTAKPEIDWFQWNAHLLPLNDFGPNTAGGGLWGNATNWSWNWKQNPPGTAVSYVSAPLSSNTAVIGAGALHVWIRSSTPNVDLLATVSEVRPDGNETFVQNGYLRADERRLDPAKSTLLAPVLWLRRRDISAVPSRRFVEAVIPLYYEGHEYRAGSRIRVTISAPNGTQPIWGFSETSPRTTAKVSIAFGPRMHSSLILPVVPGIAVPTGLPPCPSLRNEPCRPYVALVNETTLRGVYR
jgi:hypothetical protein